MVKRGEKGDASVLKPSIMFCVLLILDSINKVANTGWFQGVTDQIRRKGEVVSDILDFLIQYKIECVKRAEPTPIMDR